MTNEKDYIYYNLALMLAEKELLIAKRDVEHRYSTLRSNMDHIYYYTNNTNKDKINNLCSKCLNRNIFVSKKFKPVVNESDLIPFTLTNIAIQDLYNTIYREQEQIVTDVKNIRNRCLLNIKNIKNEGLQASQTLNYNMALTALAYKSQDEILDYLIKGSDYLSKEEVLDK